VTENNENIIDYVYHSSGQVKSITSAGTTVSVNYDNYGRKSDITDPNSGTTLFWYNAFDEMKQQKDARNTNYYYVYNTLGQVTSKTGPEGITTYSYYSSGNGLEQIQSITGPNGVSTSYTYDGDGRLNQSTESIQGDQSFITGYGYDLWNNNISVTYPSGITLNNTLNTDGYLTEIRNSGTLIWKLDDANSLGQPKQYSLGSSGLKTNFEYDTKGFVSKITTGIGEQSFNFNPNTGNLSNRKYRRTTDTTTVREYFTYDNLNRLHTSQVGQNIYTTGYSNNGNITSKTDAGSYTYDGVKLNAVTSVTNPTGIISSTAQNITYTEFNKASLITEGTYEMLITYGTDNQRIKSVLKNNGSVIKTTYYIPGYEKEVTAGGTRELHYIYSPYGLVAILIKQGGTTNTYFTETDHLGSIIGLINADGSYAEQFSFDPWGRRRNPTNWTYSGVPQPVLITRGFTAHEHLDNFGLIDMNGRMYDPVLGRFLGVDPILQEPSNSQSINGYGYCLNNPLKYTDPSGYLTRPYSYENDFPSNYVEWWEQYVHDLNTIIGPGMGMNGPGLHGVYYDWYSNTYRSVDTREPNNGPIFSASDFLYKAGYPGGLGNISQMQGFLFATKYLPFFPLPIYIQKNNKGELVALQFIDHNPKGLQELIFYLWYRDTGSQLTHFNFLQTINTNKVLKEGMSSPYIDRSSPDALMPFYYSENELYYHDSGYTVLFIDVPKRSMENGTYWDAELSVVGMDAFGQYNIILTVSWGFEINNNSLILHTITPVYFPSIFHIRSLEF
jgi:RHS repeat-associated protein